MPVLTQAADVIASIDRVKQAASQFTTCYFATPEQTQAWIDRGVLSSAESAGCLLLFRREYDFLRLYHVAACREALSAALASLPAPHAGCVAYVADLVGRPDQIAAVADIYGSRGFRTEATLMRMARRNEGASVYLPDPQVTFAEVSDVPRIAGFLERLLNRFVDQVPEAAELAKAVASRSVLVTRRGEDLGGVLLFETAGVTTTLRYWYVDQRFRDEGIGGRLMKTFLHLSRQSRRLILWVVASNADAIRKYQHYGFAADSLVDHILLQQWSQP